jgi:diguanylate cyclase (GGDEF)-like protein
MLGVDPGPSLENMSRSKELFDAFGAGVYVLFGIIHLDLWFRRRDRMAHLWLAGASASALIVDVTGILGKGREASPNLILMILNTLGVAAATVCLFELVSSLNRVPAGRLARTLQGGVLILAVLAGPVVPQLFPALFVGCMALLVWAMARAFRAAREGDRDSGMVAKGFIVLTACLLADLLKALKVVPFPSGLPIVGFIVLFLTSARSLNDRFGREEEASRTDTLTGLFNRRGFLEASDGAVLRSRRSGRPLSIVLADVDRFKEVNDSLSHAAGDAALKALSGALRSALRAQDTVARWGGDEFIVLLPDTAKEGALRVSESLRALVSDLRVDFEGARVHLTLSLGVAEHLPDRSVEDTIAEADSALYQAKEQGRDRVVVR